MSEKIGTKIICGCLICTCVLASGSPARYECDARREMCSPPAIEQSDAPHEEQQAISAQVAEQFLMPPAGMPPGRGWMSGNDLRDLRRRNHPAFLSDDWGNGNAAWMEAAHRQMNIPG